MSKQFHQQCPICNNTGIKTIYLVDGYTIDKCPECTVKFVKEQITIEELDKFYQESYSFTDDQTDFVYQNEANKINLRYYFLNLKKEIEKKVTSGKILDVGCNAGDFLEVMDNFERYGVEIMQKQAIKAKEKFGDNIFMGPFEKYEQEDNYFDCIVIQDVFDHLANPYEILVKSYRLLKPGGFFVIKVHDHSCLWAKIVGKRFYAIIPPDHLFYYNETSLKKILERTNFKFLYKKHMSHILSLNTVFLRFSRSNPKSIFFKIYLYLTKTKIGRIRIKKNLHDLITVFATK